MALKFGTDGVRGVANSELTVELSLALGRAAVRVLGSKSFVIGRDTRLSGPALSSALAAGIMSEGAHVKDVGVIPTAALSAMSKMQEVPSAMISASHNPFADNGIKLFAPGGEKLSDDLETELEEQLKQRDAWNVPKLAGEHVGTLEQWHSNTSWYAYGHHVKDCMVYEDVSGLRVVVDCANGSASKGIEKLFKELGINPIAINNEPDGVNINHQCGSTHPEGLQKEVVARGAHMGLAFDGDADRVLAVDETGELIDGDQIMCILAAYMKHRGTLHGDAMVVTVMSNLGLHREMRRLGIDVHTTAVGDRSVLEALKKYKLSLGGEQSGHIIFPRFGPTGDGIVTGLMLASLVKRSGSLRELAEKSMTRFPQVLENVRVADREKLDGATAVWDEVRQVEDELGEDGRVLLRASGTESLIRVMVEAPTEETARQMCSRLCAVVADHV